ncbi:hypothetical protein PHJA_000239900 [Phtheirospermum japonicum]|uniref:Uncharacterized protein n=1 Tax=Phtheirospermum japonicum TaxID=374723 RepID=A0A830B2K0_9LAMI|nr:hypothetical protein PHJA_000239900 [Phtheirospermum japonicum]
MSYKDDLGGFAVVHVVEEGSTIGSSEPETLGAGVAVNYVWDDLTLPHKLVVQLDDVHMLREINLDKPLDLNFDEETLMKIVPFWRGSLSDSSGPRQQYYFDHFEIHPIKIVASFLPGDSRYSYSSTQETLRSLLHSVIKV